jgi:hypothetical protein
MDLAGSQERVFHAISYPDITDMEEEGRLKRYISFLARELFI